MKYDKQKFCDAPNHVKIKIIKNELSLTTHNGLSKDDLLMLLDWCYNRLIKGDLEEQEETQSIGDKVRNMTDEQLLRLFNKLEEKGIAELETKNNGWIPCSERLPDKEGNYLTVIDGCMMPDITLFANGNFIDFLGEEDSSIIAWQPLPQPYKGE